MARFPETADIETSSDDYAARFAGRIGAWFLDVQEEAVLQMLEPYPRASILDVGGGHGQLAPALVQRGHAVTVLGSSDVCKARIQQLLDADACSFDVGDVLSLPYPDQAFDVVLSFRLLPHVTQWRGFLHELTRVAKQAIILDYPTIRSINRFSSFFFGFKKRLEGNTRPFTCFDESELLEVFSQEGFRQADRFAEFFLPMVLHRVLRLPLLSAALERFCRFTRLTTLFGSPVILRVVRKEP